MDYIPWLWLVLVHVIVRFVLQPVGGPRPPSRVPWMVARFLTTLVLAHLAFLSLRALPLLFLFAVLHSWVDEVFRWTEGKVERLAFEHLIVSEILQGFLILKLGGWLVATGTEPVALMAVAHWVRPSVLPPFDADSVHRVLVLAAGYIYALRGGTEIVRRILGKFPGLVTKEGELPGIGRAIGNLERLLLTTFVLFGQYAALGFVLAAKSIARFKDLDKRNFAEYYLVGTLASASVTVAVGLAMRALLGG